MKSAVIVWESTMGSVFGHGSRFVSVTDWDRYIQDLNVQYQGTIKHSFVYSYEELKKWLLEKGLSEFDVSKRIWSIN